jgi:transposase InsO family protein
VSASERAECILLISEAVLAGARKFKACEILELQIRTIDRRCGPLNRPANALTTKEREKILEVANSAEYANLPPCQIVPKLADRGEYIASESSFYRILNAEKLLAHRSKSNPRTHKKPKQLVAMKPNQIWSWDITYLRAAIKGTYYYLYLPMDVFSRKIVHWEIHQCETAELASAMIEKACLLNNIMQNQIVLHSDNGGPMKGATMLATLQRLGVSPSFSRPSVSNDNPYSESLFKTLKYCPSFPERGFATLEEARTWVAKFVEWYNNIHLHSGINFVTPSSRHNGDDQKTLNLRHDVYEKAKLKNPNRWSRKTRNWSWPDIVELNPGKFSKNRENQLAA